MGIDLKNFYLNTPMDRREFLRMKIDNFPEDVIKQYDLRQKVDSKGMVTIRVEKGMYGLPYAGIIAQDLLTERLNKEGYFQSDKTPGLWTHEWRPITFALVVGDFGVKYVGKQHADHLISVLSSFYEIEGDWKGKKYCGITLDWDYVKRHRDRKVHLSILGYCDEALTHFRHEAQLGIDQPHVSAILAYGAKVQYAKDDDKSPCLLPEDRLFIQQVTGTFLYYGRAVDSTMLVALSAIASDQAKPTEKTMEKTLQFLDYVAANNCAVLNVAQIIKNVMSSSAEAKIGALFINSWQAVTARTTLEEMGHIQPQTPIQTYNTTALGFVMRNLQPKATKSTYMRYWWMRDRSDRNQCRYYWSEGKDNHADYWTKHFCAAHHREQRPSILMPSYLLDTMRANKGLAPHKFRASSRVC